MDFADVEFINSKSTGGTITFKTNYYNPSNSDTALAYICNSGQVVNYNCNLVISCSDELKIPSGNAAVISTDPESNSLVRITGGTLICDKFNKDGMGYDLYCPNGYVYISGDTKLISKNTNMFFEEDCYITIYSGVFETTNKSTYYPRFKCTGSCPYTVTDILSSNARFMVGSSEASSYYSTSLTDVKTDFSVVNENCMFGHTASAGVGCASTCHIFYCKDCGAFVKTTPHNFAVDNELSVNPTCTKEGTKVSTCSICGIKHTDIVAKKAHTTKTTVTKATLSKDGKSVTKCTVCGTTTSTKTIAYPKTFTLSTTSYTYDGKVKKPSVTVKDSKGNKIAASNYIVSYSNNKNVGKATVKITFKGNYSGTKQLTFKINPKGTSISSVTAASKAFTVKWKKQATQTTGYQIQYSTDKNFKSGNKTVTVSKNSTTSKKVTGLKSKKKYYVRIRTYKTVSGTKYYSSWSKAKTVTTKK